LATAGLLDTYDAERRPNATANAEWSLKNQKILTAAVAARGLPPVPAAKMDLSPLDSVRCLRDLMLTHPVDA
jgi:hypothetical protein